jgi:L-asparaginase II
MNDHDGGMAAAEQDDADGVLSFGAGTPRAIRAPRSSWHAHDGLAAATAGIRRRFGLEGESAALAGNGGHSSNHRSISPERAVSFDEIAMKFD